MLRIRKKSGWGFRTYPSGSVGLEVAVAIGAGKGKINLTHPAGRLLKYSKCHDRLKKLTS